MFSLSIKYLIIAWILQKEIAARIFNYFLVTQIVTAMNIKKISKTW